MQANAKISITEIAKTLGISTTAIEKNIVYLKKKNIIERIDPAKGGHWQVLD